MSDKQKLANSVRGTSTPQATGNHHRTASTPVNIANQPGYPSRKGLCLAFISAFHLTINACQTYTNELINYSLQLSYGLG